MLLTPFVEPFPARLQLVAELTDTCSGNSELSGHVGRSFARGEDLGDPPIPGSE